MFSVEKVIDLFLVHFGRDERWARRKADEWFWKWTHVEGKKREKKWEKMSVREEIERKMSSTTTIERVII
jgi:hypothetical protein